MAAPENLPPAAKLRYMEKLELILGIDPVEHQSSVLPPVDASDIILYLVLQTSFVTVKQLKAHKSMEGYNQFVCSWVKRCSGPRNKREKLLFVFRKCILPELTVRFYTQSQPSVMSVTSEQALHDHTYYCKMSSTSS